MFGKIEKYWPNVVVNGHILHSSSEISCGEKFLHAKWSVGSGLLVCQRDIARYEIVSTSMGECLNLVLKDGLSEC